MEIPVTSGQKQANLSIINITLLSIAFTIIWLYLWYGGNKVMRTRKWQTWWQLGGYGIIWFFGFIGMYTEHLLDIFFHIHDVWHYPPVTSLTTMFYFELEIGWYAASLICLLINRDLKDFYPMLFHHLITPAEIFFSYQCGYAAIGLVIMFLHDTSDLFLHIAKTFHNARMSLFTDATFLLFAITFFITRLVLLPMCPYVYFTGIGDHHSFCGDALASTCSILVLLHCYWFYLIVMMIIKFARAGQVEGDIREQENDQTDSEQQKNKLLQKVAPITEYRQSNGHGNKIQNHSNGHDVTTNHSLHQRPMKRVE